MSVGVLAFTMVGGRKLETDDRKFPTMIVCVKHQRLIHTAQLNIKYCNVYPSEIMAGAMYASFGGDRIQRGSYRTSTRKYRPMNVNEPLVTARYLMRSTGM